MKKIYKCKVCAYLVKGKDTPEICPACGFKGKIFEEYESPLSEKRRQALDLHAHPAMVHFPIAFVVSMALLSLLRIVGFITEQSIFTSMLHALVIVLPFVAVSAMIAGLFDGKMRFKRIDTPHLKIKIMLATSFILISSALFVTQLFLNLDQATHNIVAVVCSFVLLGIALPLGLIGGNLIEAKVRG